MGALGQFIAIVATTAFLFGVTGPNWDNLRVGGSAMLAGFVWHLFVGFSAVFMAVATKKNRGGEPRA